MPVHLSLSEAKIISRPYGILRPLIPDEAGFKNLRAHIITVGPGQQTSKHHHPSEELFYFLSGSGVFEGSDKKFRVKEQDVILVLPNEVHQLVNDSVQDPLIYLLAMSPPRDPKQVVYLT